ncbi:MAG TPA: heavy metal translocating P-type ATPase [Anaerolineales bacterium]|nr:heavy metal translocating P-type ATPase [Anaerolineales bacterium]
MSTRAGQASVRNREKFDLSILWGRLFEDRTRIALTVLTFAAMLAGLAVELIAENDEAAYWLYAVAYLAGGFYGVEAGFRAIRERRIDVDILMVLAAAGAWIVGAPFEGAMLLSLFSLSNVLQALALRRTSKAIEALMAYRPDTALLRRGDDYETVPIEQVEVGERIVVRPGERIPLDGTVHSGTSSVDQSSLTGESMPVSKSTGDPLFAGTINLNGGLEMTVKRLAKDSAIERLIIMVSEAQGRKAHTQRAIDRLEQVYALGVILATAGLIVVPWLILGDEFNPVFYRAMGVMVAASPCAVVISTPATVLSAIGNGARRGLLFKGGIHVERAADIVVVAFDKTGTLTVGRPKVSDVIAIRENGGSEAEVLALAASIERKFEHPLSQAIVAAAEQRGLDLAEADEILSVPGKGVRGRIQGQIVFAGSVRFAKELSGELSPVGLAAIEKLEAQGKTTIVVGNQTGPIGVIAISDVIREGTREVVNRLKQIGIRRTVMLTGDNERTAAFIAGQAGLDDYHAELLPEDKLEMIEALEREYGPVLMVGDGVNDAPALAAASLGMAMGAAGSDVALETADIVLMGEDLRNIPYVVALSRATRRTLLQNLVFSFGVIAVLVGAVLGFQIPLPVSVIGHEGSTVLVSLNGLRMLKFKEK